MRITVVPVTPFRQNCSLLVDERTRKAAVLDPGGDLERILETLERTGAEPERILLTHGHIDHCGGAGELRRIAAVPVEGPQREDRFWIEQLPAQALRFGFGRVEPFEPDRWLEGGDWVRFGEAMLQVRHCPGHTPGHVIFFSAEARLALVGDVLFAGSVGRTDLPRGDFDALVQSITTQLWPLGDDVSFVSGHGPMSTFGEERASNPFVADRALALGQAPQGRRRDF